MASLPSVFKGCFYNVIPQKLTAWHRTSLKSLKILKVLVQKNLEINVRYPPANVFRALKISVRSKFCLKNFRIFVRPKSEGAEMFPLVPFLLFLCSLHRGKLSGLIRIQEDFGLKDFENTFFDLEF